MSCIPRFGVRAAVHGSRASHHDPDEPDNASWKHNRTLVLEAEALGFDAERDQLEARTRAAALAALPRRIEIIAAIKPGLSHARTDRTSVMFAETDAAASRHVGTNGGTAAGLVGSDDTVTERIRAAGIALFILQFQPFEAEMRCFAEQILPRVR